MSVCWLLPPQDMLKSGLTCAGGSWSSWSIWENQDFHSWSWSISKSKIWCKPDLACLTDVPGVIDPAYLRQLPEDGTSLSMEVLSLFSVQFRLHSYLLDGLKLVRWLLSLMACPQLDERCVPKAGMTPGQPRSRSVTQEPGCCVPVQQSFCREVHSQPTWGKSELWLSPCKK